MQTESGTTIGLTYGNRVILDELMQKGWFEHSYHIGQFAFAISINNDINPGKLDGPAETIWNMGTFDRDGKIRSLVNILHPEAQVVNRYIEYHVNKGLNIIGDMNKENSINTPLELIEHAKSTVTK